MKQAIVRPEQRDLLSQVFHTLSQPLTATQCSLEVALECAGGSGESRSLLESALENLERLRREVRLLRELSQSDDPGDLSRPVELGAVLAKAMEPLLGEAHVIDGRDGVCVVGDGERLLRAFFYVLEALCNVGEPELASAVRVTVTETDGEVRVTIAGVAVEQNRLSRSLSWEVARMSFEAVGGQIGVRQAEDNTSVCEVVLQRYEAATAKAAQRSERA